VDDPLSKENNYPRRIPECSIIKESTIHS